MQVAEGLNNPEPIINAVVAALEAQRSGILTNGLLVALIVIASIVAVSVVIALVKLETIQIQTNGMYQALVGTPKKLSLIAGVAKDKAAQNIDDENRMKGENNL